MRVFLSLVAAVMFGGCSTLADRAEISRLEEHLARVNAQLSVSTEQVQAANTLVSQLRQELDEARDRSRVERHRAAEQQDANARVVEKRTDGQAAWQMRAESGIAGEGSQQEAIQQPAASAKMKAVAAAPLRSLTNSIGMKFVEIPAGTFAMGAADGESSGQPIHEVTLPMPFYLGVCEVTNGQWYVVMDNVPSRWKDADRPVESVSWDDAIRFCDRLSKLPAERRVGREYRLPTEAEWEYACRAGTKTKYSFGDDTSLLVDFAWFNANSGNQTHPVCRKQPNPWGLYDLHGNVWEWCSDWYGDYAAGAVRDPLGPATGTNRVLRGGGWYGTANRCRSACRYRDDPSFRYAGNGFRLVLIPADAGAGEAVE